MGNRTSHFFVTHGSKEKNADLSKEIPSEDLIISVSRSYVILIKMKQDYVTVIYY